MVLFFILNFLAAGSAFLCGRMIFDRGPYKNNLEARFDFSTAVFCLYLAQIVVTELLLGVAGRLRPVNLLLLNGALFLGALNISRRRKPDNNFCGPAAVISSLLSNKAVRLGFCVILCFGLVKVLVNLLNPPFGWDSLNYHFTFAVEWLKHADLGVPITINDDFAPTYYPVNGSLYFFWLMMPLGNVFLADLGQLPFFAAAFLALFGIARKLKLDREEAFFAASLFTLIPNFFKQLQIAYVDVMVAALFFYCLNILFLLHKKFSRANVLFSGIGLGLLLGTKLIALPLCALLGIAFVCVMFRSRGVNAGQALLIVIFAVLALGGFSYIRNFFETGNPFYPLDVRLWGRRILPGVIERSSYASRFRPGDYGLEKLLFHEGLGAQVLLFVLPASLIALPAIFLKKKKEAGPFLLYFLALPLLLWLVFRYLIPFANTRYLYPLLGVGMVSAFYLYRALNLPRMILRVLYCVCVLASVSELAKRQELVCAILLTIAAFFLLPAVISRAAGLRQLIKRPVFIAASLAVLFIFLKSAESYYIKNEFRRYGQMRKYSGFWPEATAAWDWLNSNTAGNNIAYVGRPVPFPLYGSRFKNNVYYVSVNATEPAKLHYYPESFYHWGESFSGIQHDFEAAGNYRSAADYSVWLDNLRKKDTDYLFVYSLHQTETLEFPVEDAWALQHPEVFEPVFGNISIKIYKMREP